MTMPFLLTRLSNPGAMYMKKLYVEPDLEWVRFKTDDVCDVVHTSFEQGGGNSGFNYGNEDDDDEDFGDSP